MPLYMFLVPPSAGRNAYSLIWFAQGAFGSVGKASHLRPLSLIKGRSASLPLGLRQQAPLSGGKAQRELYRPAASSGEDGSTTASGPGKLVHGAQVDCHFGPAMRLRLSCLRQQGPADSCPLTGGPKWNI